MISLSKEICFKLWFVRPIERQDGDCSSLEDWWSRKQLPKCVLILRTWRSVLSSDRSRIPVCLKTYENGWEYEPLKTNHI